jgi:hypothetical protein
MALASRNARFRDCVQAHPALDCIRGLGAEDIVANPKKRIRREDSQEASPSQPDAEDSQMSTMDDWI